MGGKLSKLIHHLPSQLKSEPSMFGGKDCGAAFALQLVLLMHGFLIQSAQSGEVMEVVSFGA